MENGYSYSYIYCFGASSFVYVFIAPNIDEDYHRENQLWSDHNYCVLPYKEYLMGRHRFCLLAVDVDIQKGIVSNTYSMESNF